MTTWKCQVVSSTRLSRTVRPSVAKLYLRALAHFRRVRLHRRSPCACARCCGRPCVSPSFRKESGVVLPCVGAYFQDSSGGAFARVCCGGAAVAERSRMPRDSPRVRRTVLSSPLFCRFRSHTAVRAFRLANISRRSSLRAFFVTEATARVRGRCIMYTVGGGPLCRPAPAITSNYRCYFSLFFFRVPEMFVREACAFGLFLGTFAWRACCSFLHSHIKRLSFESSFGAPELIAVVSCQALLEAERKAGFATDAIMKTRRWLSSHSGLPLVLGFWGIKLGSKQFSDILGRRGRQNVRDHNL